MLINSPYSIELDRQPSLRMPPPFLTIIWYDRDLDLLPLTFDLSLLKIVEQSIISSSLSQMQQRCKFGEISPSGLWNIAL